MADAVSALLGGGILLILALTALPAILLFIAFWRMGYGLKLTGEALHNGSGHGTGRPDVSQSLAALQSNVQLHALATSRLADAMEKLAASQEAAAKQAEAATKASASAAEANAALAKQAELAVQWYAHSLQSPDGSAGKSKK